MVVAPVTARSSPSQMITQQLAVSSMTQYHNCVLKNWTPPSGARGLTRGKSAVPGAVPAAAGRLCAVRRLRYLTMGVRIPTAQHRMISTIDPPPQGKVAKLKPLTAPSVSSASMPSLITPVREGNIVPGGGDDGGGIGTEEDVTRGGFAGNGGREGRLSGMYDHGVVDGRDGDCIGGNSGSGESGRG